MTTQQQKAHTPHQHRRTGSNTGRYTLTERDIQTLTPETDADNAFTFAESDCTPVVDLARSARRGLSGAPADGSEELAQLIEPQELSLLLDAYFDKQPVVLRAKDNKDRFSHFYARAHIERALNKGLIARDHMKLVTAKGEFCTQVFLDSQSHKRQTLGERAVEFVTKKGGTFNVSRIYNHSLEVAGLVRTLNRLFKARISASAFFTGPHGQAFPVHWDVFDTFIFQVEGEKNWTVYEPLIQAPLPDIHYCTRYDMRKLTPIFDIDLAAGDLMMVPRGYPHRARTKRSNSIHLTVGVHTPTWQDFFATVLNRSLVEARPLESFRSDCYVCNAPRNDREKYAQTMLDQLVVIARSVIKSDYFLDHIAIHNGIDANGCANADGLSSDENTVFFRQGGFYFLDRVGDQIHFRWNNKGLVLPGYASDTIEFMAKTPRFKLRDLPKALTTRGQIVLLKKMCAIGFLMT